MASENLGLTASVAMALGGMIGGGIYAVLGVVTQVAGAATWFAFLLAGVVAACAGYAYNVLNALADGNGGVVTFVQSFTGNTTLAGMAGWTLLVGYIGSIAMYAFAFAEFTITLPGVPEQLVGVPLRPVVSVGIVALFVALNTLGTRVTGSAENVLVALKVGILVVFGVAGLAYAYGFSAEPVQYGFSQLRSFGPVMAAGVSFVAFQGWQLLFYDQESITDPVDTIRKAVYIAVPAAIVIYILVAVATFNLVPQAVQQQPHTALTTAASRIAAVGGLARLGGLILSLSALFSTGSAINATLFSSGYFAKGLLSDDLLPDRVGDASTDGVPTRTVVALGVVTAGFAVAGSLEAITNFASVAFIVVFGATNVLAVSQRTETDMYATIPVVGAVGSFGFLLLLLYHLYEAEPQVFATVCLLSVVIVGIELLYFEHETIAREVEQFEPVDV